MKVKTEVTLLDVLLGVPKSCYWCPIARSIRRHLDSINFSYSSVEVDGSDIKVETPSHYDYYLSMDVDMANRVNEFTGNFDDGLKTACFTLEGDLVPEEKE